MTEHKKQVSYSVQLPSNLPFLQAQILERIYLNISKDKPTTLEELSVLTDYPPSGQILLNSIKALISKGFLHGVVDEPPSFLVPKERADFFRKVIERSDFAHKYYSRLLIENFASQPGQLALFLEKQNLSEINKHGIIHRWYSYLEDFPYWLIDEKIREYKIDQRSLILDPFCGSGTTLVSAKIFNINSVGFDVNPLMAFVSRVKTEWDMDLSKFKSEIISVASEFFDKVKILSNNCKFENNFISRMPKKELVQWLSPTLQKEVSLLKHIINKVENVPIKEAFLLAMCKACFDASYVSLCPGTTFYPFKEKREFWDLFSEKVIQIYNDLKLIQEYSVFTKPRIIIDSCLNVQEHLDNNSVNFIITSPPYPNDLEYTRQTRLELYLLDFVHDMNDIQNIKRKMVKGSTKLIFKESNSARHVEGFADISKISNLIYEQTKEKQWGFDYPRMVREYFGDMYLCLKKTYPVLANGAHFLLVVGNQTIKGIVIPVGDILLELAQEIGYKNCRKELFRTRRSTNHKVPLPEEIVILEK